ncbi:MAG TPA: ABC transporter ATP-binding protein [Candidatus Peribacteria bacterium]|nr:ABC transporter ATP-binding protein [Candidatus Peribacteria bacterium]
MKVFFALASATWKYSAGRRKQVLAYVGLLILANIVYLFEPYVVGKVLNTVQEASVTPGSLPKILAYLLMVIGINAGFWLFHGPARVMERLNAFHARNDFKDHLFNIITSLPVQWHKQHHSGQTINRIGKATRALGEFTENSYQLIEMMLRPAVAVVALALIMPQAALIAVVVGGSALSLVFLFDRVLLPLYDQVNAKEHFVAAALHDYITNITTVITLRLEQLTRSELWIRMAHYLPVFRREAVINEWKWFLATIVMSSMTVIVLGWYAYTTIGAGVIPLAGTFFMLYEYLQKISGAFFTFAWKYSTTVQQYADLRAVEPILQAAPAEYHGGCVLPKDWKTIEINHLDFVYKDEEKREHHLRDVSVTLGRRSKIAFVGESGSGKSTLMTLIRGLHSPDKAEVLCDGKPLAHGLKDVGSKVTLIPQEPEIFENTIEYNITLDTEQTNAEILDDVRLACFESTLEKLPNGLKTNTAEKGVNLSGGEKQRLALARGFFAAKQSDIILLDEPTSSVDSTNELKIYRNLLERFADRCIISSIHKLHLLELFEEVYVFENGRLLQRGTFRELIAKDGRMKELWDAYNRRETAAA